MYYVYLLKSTNYDQSYIGFTTDLKRRIADHNAGKSHHTKKFKPWKLVNYTAFDQEQNARDFERYLKTGSGKAFIGRHLL